MTLAAEGAYRAADRVDALIDRGTKRRIHLIVTPEGIELPVALAEHSERLVAFLFDMLFWLGTTLLIYIVAIWLVVELGGPLVAFTLITLIAFLVRNLYFIYFEMMWGGATPGKKIAKLRVIDRRGGPLMPAAVIARNLTRELEVFLPISVFANLTSHGASANWQSFFLLIWLLLLSGLPLFNKARMRGGDIIAGTLLVSVPKRVLLDDIAEQASSAYRFTSRQLQAYGSFELQVLEELLRRTPSEETSQLHETVAGKIAAKIGWSDPVPPSETHDFLKAFYAAERAHLEREQAFGRIYQDKHARGGQDAA